MKSLAAIMKESEEPERDQPNYPIADPAPELTLPWPFTVPYVQMGGGVRYMGTIHQALADDFATQECAQAAIEAGFQRT